MARLLVAQVGATAVFASGRDFAEPVQQEVRQELLDRLRATLAAHNVAQLIFDDFHLALTRSHGFRLQAQLASLLIDSREGADIGALFLARWAGPIDIPGRGSPLISRCAHAELPTWDSTDLVSRVVNC